MFGERLRAARKKKNLTLEQLAALYNSTYNGGLSKGTLSKYENNIQEPMVTTVANLATILGVSTDYLMEMDEDIDLSLIKNISPIVTKKIPLLGSIACGKPIFAEENYDMYIDMASDIDADFCLTAKGDSMIGARINDGDLVFIRKQSDVNNGEIAAVLIDDEATLKRVYKTADTLTLVAENPAYPPMVYTESNYSQIRILGRAIAFQSIVK